MKCKQESSLPYFCVHQNHRKSRLSLVAWTFGNRCVVRLSNERIELVAHDRSLSCTALQSNYSFLVLPRAQSATIRQYHSYRPPDLCTHRCWARTIPRRYSPHRRLHHGHHVREETLHEAPVSAREESPGPGPLIACSLQSKC